MKKENLLFIVMALVIGLLVGLLVSKGDKQKDVAQVADPSVPVPNHQQNIQMLEKLVADDPGNRGGWVQLGHSYFDTDQPVKAIEAYNKALAIDGNDPDVLTDQGVMFRRLGWYDRAVENFKRASELNPQHQQCLYNLGVVYRYDLQDFAHAREAWNRYLEINPTGPGADNIRRELADMGTAPTSTVAPPK